MFTYRLFFPPTNQQPSSLHGPKCSSDGAVFMGCPGHLALHKCAPTFHDSAETLHVPYHNKASILPSQLHCGKTKREHQSPSLCARLMMAATDHQHLTERDTGVWRGPSCLCDPPPRPDKGQPGAA